MEDVISRIKKCAEEKRADIHSQYWTLVEAVASGDGPRVAADATTLIESADHTFEEFEAHVALIRRKAELESAANQIAELDAEYRQAFHREAEVVEESNEVIEQMTAKIEDARIKMRIAHAAASKARSARSRLLQIEMDLKRARGEEPGMTDEERVERIQSSEAERLRKSREETDARFPRNQTGVVVRGGPLQSVDGRPSVPSMGA